MPNVLSVVVILRFPLAAIEDNLYKQEQKDRHEHGPDSAGKHKRPIRAAHLPQTLQGDREGSKSTTTQIEQWADKVTPIENKSE